MDAEFYRNRKPRQKAFNRQHITSAMTQEANVSPKLARDIIDLVVGEIGNELAQGNQVMISGFGRFETRQSRERMGRNPNTGEAAKISARKSLKFFASDGLREALNRSIVD